MTWLIVTPARNEAARLPGLAASLARQAPGVVGCWVVVDDGSSDGTATCLPPELPFPTVIVPRQSDGGLARGSAFSAWWFGVEHGLGLLPDAERVLKLDADVVLGDDYLALLAAQPGDVGLIGGVLIGAEEASRADHVRGALKAYNRAALEVLRELPVALAFDVVDQVALRRAGMEVRVVPEARASVTRLTGSSEGLLRGRWRGGRVARWTGYHPLYVLLRIVRYLVRPPYVVGSIATAAGWLAAGPGPYPTDLRRAQRDEQSRQLKALVLRPRQTLPAYRRTW